MEFFIGTAHAAEQAALWAVGLQHNLGIELSVATAGALGAVASLAFIRDINARMSILSVLCGVGVSVYFTVPVMEYLGANWQLSASWKNPVALMLGLCGFHILAGVYQIGKRWRADPFNSMKELRK